MPRPWRASLDLTTEPTPKDLKPGHFVPAPGRGKPGPYSECFACGAWRKDHGAKGECPPYRKGGE